MNAPVATRMTVPGGTAGAGAVAPPTLPRLAGSPRPDPADEGSRRLRSRFAPNRAVEYAGVTGLRAVAVALVVGYHFLPDSLPGGFLGVDVFFAVSGYLITRLLLRRRARGPLSLTDFYVRRARRLLPALAAVLLTVTAAALVWRDQLATIRSADLAAATYTSNWWLIFGHQSYFVASGRPSMLQHLWSLAIEEQFYLVWPIVLVLLTRRITPFASGRAPTERLRRIVTGVAAGGALLSAVLMYAQAVAADVPFGADGSRQYFGTDTHISGLMLGAALGAWTQLRPPMPRRRGRRLPAVVRAPWLSDLGGLIALVVLIKWGLHFTEFSPGLFRTGFASTAVLCCAVIAAITRRGSLLGRLLDCPPLYWLGERSYAIYLWHWPVAVVTRPGLDIDASPGTVAVVRTALTLVLAELSHRFVEQPVRRDGWDGVQRGVALWRERVALPSVGVAVALAAALALCMNPPPAPELITHPAAQPVTPGPATPVVRQTSAGPGAGSRSAGAPAPGGSSSGHGRPSSGPASSHPSSASSSASAGAPSSAAGRSASLYGDSVLLGASPALDSVFGTVTVDAVEGRLPRPILLDLQRAASAHRLGRIVVIHVGNNGVISPDDLKATLRASAGALRVVLVNDMVDRPWQDANNRLLAAQPKHFANVVLLDWNAEASAHRDWLYPDGLHVTPSGAKHYAALVLGAAGS